jgi:membrane protein YqaA with SNARE-associated domain
MLEKLYNKVLAWSLHPKAAYYLGFLSFIDASVFPISPNFMIIPMSYSKPQRAFSFAAIATVGSVFGGIMGYGLGLFAFDTLMSPFIRFMGYQPLYQGTMEWFQNYGFWAILLAGFSPFIPYKIFTIGAGVLQLNLFWFLIASGLGRALRFYGMCFLIQWSGPKIEPYVRKMLTKAS